MAELLLECHSEEIPAGCQSVAVLALPDLFRKFCAGRSLSHGDVRAYVTARRLILHATDIPEAAAGRDVDVRGPRVGAPEAAVAGFAHSHGTEVSALEQRETPKGLFYFHSERVPAAPSAPLLKEVVEAVLTEIPWPKSMYWGGYDVRWIRPLHSVLCVFAGETLPVRFGHIAASNLVRTKGGAPLPVADFASYAKILEEDGVLWDQDARKAFIARSADEEAASLGLVLRQDPALLAEVTGLAERPVVLHGRFSEDFLELPPEVLTSAMRIHQKYFSVRDEVGRIAPYFVFVADGVGKAHEGTVVKGNERVLRARLQDALFFKRQDLSRKLETRLEDLKNVTFHADLGSLYDKALRLQSLAKLIAVWVPGANLVHVERAATLCKCDLATMTVAEFTELQGIVGGYYAACENEAPEVAAAVRDHYLPEGPNTPCPSHPVGVVLALADKVDSLCGLFAAGERATGSKDPYALRRYAQGIIRLVTENNLRIPMKLLLDKALSRYPSALFRSKERRGVKRIIPIGRGGESVQHKKEGLEAEMLEFFRERLRALLKDQGVPHGLAEAVLNDGDEQDLVRTLLKLKALRAFLDGDKAVDLVRVYKRATGILAQQEKKDGGLYSVQDIDEDLFSTEEEKRLYRCLCELRSSAGKRLQEDAFAEVFREYAAAFPALSRFFDAVTVNAEDDAVRKNRLALLSGFRDVMLQVADLSQVQAGAEAEEARA
jgi:glycyl-tRNA synthetase beta chain